MSQIFYEIEVLDEQIDFNGKHYNKSVRVVEFYAQKKIRERYLGWVDKETIYNEIDAKRPIVLDDCYVKDFSMFEYRRSRKIPEKEEVVIHGWSAKSAFFDCDSYTDFSYVKFDNDVIFDHAIFSHGSLNFTHTIFESSIVDFSDCAFHSHQTIFQYSEFQCDNINFENSNFNGELVSFINASIKSKMFNFKRVNFHHCKVKFHFAEFGTGTKTFEKIKFHGPVLDFRRVIWGDGKIDFRRSIFGSGHVTFEESQIESGKMTFRLAKFEGGDLTFRRTAFGKDEANFDHIGFGCRNITFEACTVSKLSIANSDIHATLDLRVKKADEIDLSDSYLHSITDLNFAKKDACQILRISGTRNLGKIIIEWNKNNVRDLILRQEGDNGYMADQFNILKDNFTQNGQYTDEDWAYVYFKRYQHKARRDVARKRFKITPAVDLLYFLKSIVFDHLGLYATSPNRVFLSMNIVLVIFAGIYVLFDAAGVGELVNSVGAQDNLGTVEKSMYHSAITFFTIGYGDYYPIHWTRSISAVEGWVGVFLMSYFTVAFVRKILR